MFLEKLSICFYNQLCAGVLLTLVNTQVNLSLQNFLKYGVRDTLNKSRVYKK